MPRWIYNCPPEEGQENEMRFARLLNACLPESWIVRWGYWYVDDSGILREGDFLIFGPTGGLAVLEVKTNLGHHVAAGGWGTEDGGNPVLQLQAQHRGVLRRLKSVAGERRLPFVVMSLVLPSVEVDDSLAEYRGMPRSHLLAANDLARFFESWGRMFGNGQPIRSDQRDVFLEAYGEGIDPRRVEAFVNETEQMLLRHRTTGFPLLDVLADNRQLVVEGGAGSGKSWYAIEQARRLAENESGEAGREVLMVVYNLALCENLGRTIEMMKLKRGSIRVESAESLAAAIIEACGLPHEVPSDFLAAQEYYDSILPQLALDVIESEPERVWEMVGCYDALVVDEAQDHDTCLGGAEADADSGEAGEGSHLGWWSIFAALLREEWDAPIAIFGDQAQRPPFRPTGRFRLDQLRVRLRQHAHVRLDQALRYTRPIYKFLKGLEACGTEELVAGLPRRSDMLDGPEVALHETSAANVVETMGKILAEWRARGLCAAPKILLLYDRSQIENTALAGVERLYQYRLVTYTEFQETEDAMVLPHCSIHKAKGLDALAVILLVPKPFDQIDKPGDRFTYFMGASRARQVLACVHVVD